MTCRRCSQKDDFCDGNSSENLCKHCLDHCCENCFKEFETEKEYEHSVCNDCYEITFEIYGKDENNNLIFISNEGEYYNENGNIIDIKGIKINFDIEEKTPNIFD